MGKILRKARERLLQRRNAHAMTLKSMKSGQNPGAFKAPGSLRKKKCR